MNQATLPAPQTPKAGDAPRFMTFRTVGALVLREMSTTYGRSPGGYIWAIIQPVFSIVVLSFGFSLLMRSPSLGTSFLLFYAAGVLPLRMFTEMSSNVGNAIQFNRSLMAYPRVTYIDAILARALLTLITQIMVNCVIIVGIFMYDDVRVVMDFKAILQSYASAILLGIGVGTLNCYLLLAYPLWRTIWGILTRPLFILSAIFYLFEELPQFAQEILWYNPLIHVTGLNRSGFFVTYEPSYISLLYVAVFSVIPLFFGLLILRRYSKDPLFK
jgi:capsular polysaccharide transport system permease protein